MFGAGISGADEGPEKVFLQAVAGTGNLIGGKILVLDSGGLNSGSGSIIAVDPKGRFFLAAVVSIPNQQSSNLLIFQALDPTGHPSGNPKVLDHDVGYMGIDILKE